jgi:zinc protease
MSQQRVRTGIGGILAVPAVVLGLWVGLAGPAQAQVFNPQTFTLANGLEVVVLSNHRAPIVSHMVWYRAGAADEPQGKSGIAHFLEHLMFKGTPSMPPGEFSRQIARIGGRDNAFTSLDYTGYFQNVPRDKLETVMALEADRMVNLVLSDEVVDPERDVIIEERRSVVDNRPQSRLREQMARMLYLNHPYGRPVIGWLHEMRGLTRQDAIDWYRTHYAPNNAILIVAGDVTVAELKPLAERIYGPIAARPVPKRVRPQEPPPQAARRVELRDERVRQPSLSRMYLAPSYTTGETQHAYPLQVMVEILGGGATSRLYRALVLESQVATGAGSFYDSDSLDMTSLGISASPRPGVEPVMLEAELDKVLAKVLAEGFTAEEVERAKSRMRMQAVFARDSLQTGARVFGNALTTGQSVADVEDWPNRIARVTVEQVNAAARAVLRLEASVTGLLLPKPSS